MGTLGPLPVSVQIGGGESSKGRAKKGNSREGRSESLIGETGVTFHARGREK